MVFLLGLLLFPIISLQAAIEPEDLATQVAESLKERLTDSKIQTVAISRIKQVGTRYNVTDLIDFTNVKIVRGRRLRVVDRSKQWQDQEFRSRSRMTFRLDEIETLQSVYA